MQPSLFYRRYVYAPLCAPPTCLPALFELFVFAFPPPFGAINIDDLFAAGAFFFLSFLFFPVLNNDITKNFSE